MKIYIETAQQEERAMAAAISKAQRGVIAPADVKDTARRLEDLLEILTDKRVEILRLVRARRPTSIYALAKLAGRDRKSVTDDVNILLFHGFLQQRKVRGKGRARNELRVPYKSIEVQLEL